MKEFFATIMVFITSIFGIGNVPNQNEMPAQPSPISVTISPTSTVAPTKLPISPSPKARATSRPIPTIVKANCGQMTSGTYACRIVDNNNRCYYCDNGSYIYSNNSNCAGGCPPIRQNCAEFNHGTYGCRVVDGNNRCYYCDNGSYIYSNLSDCPNSCQ
jgi:hypothetical protein